VAGMTCAPNSSYPSSDLGYFKNPENPNILYACLPLESCSPSSSEKTFTECGNGYTGWVCGSCIDFQFYKSGANCVPCPSLATKVVVYLVFAILAVVIFWRMSSFESFSALASVKIILFWIQIIALFPSLSTSWSPYLRVFFSLISFVNFDVDLFFPGKFFFIFFRMHNLFILECTLRITFWNKFYAKLLIPLLLMFTYMLRWSILKFRELKSFRISMELVKDRLEFIFIVSVSIFFSIIYSTLISPFDCVRQKDGSYSLWTNASILCYNSDWNSLHLPWIITFGLFYVVGYIALMVKFFVRVRKNISKASKAPSEQSYEYLTRYYKDTVYWWEGIHTLKKILILSIGRLAFSNDQTSKYFATFFLLLFFLLLEVIVFPYARSSMRLSLLWNAIALLLLITDGLLFKSSEISEYTKAACAFSLIALVIFVLLLSTYHIVKTRWTHTKSRRFKGESLYPASANNPEKRNLVQTEFEVDQELFDAISSNTIKGETEIKLSWKLLQKSKESRLTTTAIDIQPFRKTRILLRE
jgi:hypothetical protein